MNETAHYMMADKKHMTRIKHNKVLFGLSSYLASHLEQSLLSNSICYYSAGDCPTCFASSTLIPESSMQCAV